MRTYQKYPEETIRLLIFSMPEWGNTTCIYLAINNYNLNFLSQTPCKELNDRLWNWGTHVKNECMWHVNEDMKESEQNVDILQKQNVDILQKQNVDILQKQNDGGKYHEKNSQNSTVLQVENKNDCPPLSSANGDSGEEQEEIEHCRVCDECSDHKKLAKISIWTMFCFCTTNKYDPIVRKLLAPSVLVLLQLLGHLVFLVLYAMLLVSVLHPGSFHWLEWLVWAWIITFLCEEFNQYLRNPLFKWKQLFFIVELISLIFFFGGYGLRIAVFYNPTSVTMINYTHVILGMSYIGFSVGLLEICYSSEFFGPLMAMFKNMLLKLLRFMVIILVFFFSYAVASESVLYPRSKLTPLLAYNVIRKAFWGMFGEFFLDELESQEGDIDEPTCTNDPSLYEDYGQLRCPTGTGRYFVPILLGFYFLTINILLFNIIIAVFNSEIKRIEKKAEGVWRRHSLKFTTKYHKMLFPAPIFLWIFPFLVKFVYAKEKFSPFLKEITEAEKPLQLRLSRIQDEIREQYIVDMAGQDLRDETINISCKVNCPHTDSPEYQQTFSRPVRGDPVNEESAVAVLTTTRPLMTSRRNSDGSWATQRNRFFAVRTRYKYGLRWDCVRVRPLSRKQLRHDVDPKGLNVKITSS
ncbi:transient receptor potential cation channel subfamily M member 1-like [Physella acuta]|uniref:transient receptor potential cation channel subfamily M member 1-like n=1 Tax=Physella acuta TaxID=109671 RepID=UPI0027DE5046|nr:transient receptor potential cation channel subfamily M member 1-like [Physella acuta]